MAACGAVHTFARSTNLIEDMYALYIIAFVAVAALAYRFSETLKARRAVVHAENETKLEKALDKYREIDD